MKAGVAGAGMIVPFFLRAAALAKDMEVRALFARKAEARGELCGKFGIPVQYDSYENMLADPELDVIYVALPNDLHFLFAKEALEAGKHVILEKPFTVTCKEAGCLAELAREKGLYLFEAITNMYNPNYGKIMELLPRLGDVKIVQINYSQYSSRYDAFKQGIICPVFDAGKAGGALTDLNIYNIHLVVGLFGKPEAVRYYPNMERGVDTSGVLLLKYPGFQCVLIGAKDCAAPVGLNIQGDKGYITSSSKPNVLSEFTLQENKSEPETYHLADSPERLYYELEEFSRAYREEDKAFFEERLEHSLRVMEVLELARENSIE